MSLARSRTLRVLSLGLVLTATATLLGVAWTAQAGPRSERGDLDALRSLQQGYAAIESTYLEASLRMWLRGTRDDPFPATIGHGRFSYSGAGHQYRIRSEMDESLGLATNMDLVYDGRQFQIHDFATDVLSYQTTDTRALPIAVPNPLFLALDFLNRDNDRCRACSTQLTDMNDRSYWNQRLQDAQSITRGGARAVRIAGGTHQGTPFFFEVTLANFPQGRLPKQIDRYTEDGRIMARVVLHEYELFAVGDTQVPIARKLSIASADYEGDREQNMFADIVVDTIEVNAGLPGDAFAIDLAAAGTVWDGDQGRFLKHATQDLSSLPTLATPR